VPDSPSLRLTGSFTLEAWIYADNYSNFPNILAKDFNLAYRWRVDAGGRPWVLINDGGGFEVIRSTAVSLPLKTWFHNAVTFNASNGEVKFYVNGALVDTLTTTKSSIADT